jgi:hypothetical protein
MAVLEDQGFEDALVWCWYVGIDEHGFISKVEDLHELDGHVLADLADFYYLGNCSSMLMSRRVFEASGGFDSSLRERGAQGCEDYAFALSVAEKYPFRVVKRPLVGYRLTQGNMSGNTMTMWRSWSLVTESFVERHPELKRRIDNHRTSMTQYWYYRALSGRSYADALFFFKLLYRTEEYKVRSLAYVSIKILGKTLLEKLPLAKLSGLRRPEGRPYLQANL